MSVKLNSIQEDIWFAPRVHKPLHYITINMIAYSLFYFYLVGSKLICRWLRLLVWSTRYRTGRSWIRSSSPPKHRKRKESSERGISRCSQVCDFSLVWRKKIMRWIMKTFLISGEFVQRKSEEPPASRPCLWTLSVCRPYQRWESVSYRIRIKIKNISQWAGYVCLFRVCRCRESCRRPGGWRCSTDTHWFCIFSAVMPAPKRPNCRSHWRRFHCSGTRLKHSKLIADHFLHFRSF